jgi:hypothetical protein
VGAIERLVEALLGVAVLRDRPAHRAQGFGDHRAHQLGA